MVSIRHTKNEDIDDLKQVLDETALFPSDMLPDMVNNFLSSKENEDVWLSCEAEGSVIGFCYAAPETLADGTWNMLAIAVLPGKQGSGVGTAIVNELERKLSEQKQRVLIADTSGTDEFSQARQFYLKSGYSEEARIRDFWAKGDDKVVFWKSLN